MLKSDRNRDIIQIITSQSIGSQEVLLEELRKLGHEITQATLSRNLKEMGIGRKPDGENGYVYFISNAPSLPESQPQSANIPPQSIISLEYSYNFAILKTIPGFASSVAMVIDSSQFMEIAGTIAGDDTILIIPREPFTKTDIQKRIREAFPLFNL
jgi:transcriptional regulator of arginine metabolism